MHAVLLTWNPGRTNDYVWSPGTWERTVVTPCREGQTYETTWGVAQHVNDIGPGVDAFLYRQGAWGRGIIARGTIRSFPAPAPHWDETRARRGVTTKIVDVELHDALPVEDALEVVQLEAIVPEFAWRKVYSSGRVLSSPVAAKLRRAWEWHAAGR